MALHLVGVILQLLHAHRLGGRGRHVNCHPFVLRDVLPKDIPLVELLQHPDLLQELLRALPLPPRIRVVSS
eukprot:6260721-Pyramimonas_sp.AAC.1